MASLGVPSMHPDIDNIIKANSHWADTYNDADPRPFREDAPPQHPRVRPSPRPPPASVFFPGACRRRVLLL